MNRRLVLGSLAVVLLIGLAGCTMFFTGISDDELDREQEYDDLRDSEADVRIDIEEGGILSSGEYRAVYDLNGTEDFSLSQSTFYSEEPLDIHSVRYWYPNGTEVTGSELDVDQDRSSTDLSVPDGNGTLAFSGATGGSTFQLPTYVTGSYEVTLPEGERTSNFLFGDASPSGYDREVVDDQERLYWDNADGTIALRYYSAGGVTLFLGLVGVVVIVGGIGVAYYYRQVQQLQEQREELGLDVEIEDDDDGPPPGLK
ncbi:hypothetical protein C482_16413 [Natrialba chahannaoensis JCM 10990]|uniref:Lipoprotein n=1 Tax=Natrialba chahannaoensis JCM 10990 TaxID=1227492 RepID=M0AA32_9EURY|nr:DUF5803 family protein [Natrialba chahannaoensis]ELY95246.1 hypothetical protein C482_16413 [Natrialba chahannaoensis JCM 10990]